MALFESYDRRIDKVNAALNTYGIKDIDEAKAIWFRIWSRRICRTGAE